MLTPSQIRAVRILACISGTISVVGASLLVGSFILFKELRTHSSKLILFLSIADLGEALAWTLSPASDYSGPCELQGYGIQLFGASAVLWQACISFYLLQVNLGKKDLHKQEIYYHVICWGVPLLTIVGGGIGKIFGYAGAWCWVTKQYDVVGLVILYLPALVCIIFSIAIYVWVGVILNKTPEVLDSSNGQEDSIKLHSMKKQLRTRFYIIPFALGWIFGLINRMHNAFSPNRIPTLFVLQAILFPLQGFWNFLMYGLTERIVAPQSMRDLMLRSDTRRFFVQHLSKLRCQENVDFWLDVERLYGMRYPSEERTSKACQIYEQYVVPGAPDEVNLHGHVKDKLGRQFQTRTFEEHAFKEAQTEIFDLMRTNTTAFEKSPEYKEMLAELQSKEAMTGQIEGRLLIFVLLYHKVWRGTFLKLLKRKKPRQRTRARNFSNPNDNLNINNSNSELVTVSY